MKDSQRAMYSIAQQMTSKASLIGVMLVTSLATCELGVAQEELIDLASNIGAELDQSQTETADAQSPQDEMDQQSLPLLIQSEREFDQTLAAQTKPEQHAWLDIKYPGAASAHQSLALQTKNKSAVSHGAVLIIPNTAQHADWPMLVRGIRGELPFRGWMTLSINLPWPEMMRIPERSFEAKAIEGYAANESITRALAAGSRSSQPEAGDNSTETTDASDANTNPDENLDESQNNEDVDINLKEETDSAFALPKYADRALVHLQAAMDYLSQQGFQNIALLSIGESANIAIEYIQSREQAVEDKGFALIMVDPQLRADINDNFTDALGIGFPAPLLDIYSSTSPAQREHARVRNASARAGGFLSYQQIRVPAPDGPGSEGFISKRIGDWLNRYAPGEKQNK